METVKAEVYRAIDGKIFLTKRECELYEEENVIDDFTDFLMNCFGSNVFYAMKKYIYDNFIQNEEVEIEDEEIEKFTEAVLDTISTTIVEERKDSEVYQKIFDAIINNIDKK
ncbi:MAG: hypothetical protein ACOC22_01720 [bacterium]